MHTLLAAPALLWVPAARAQSPELAELVNQAGRQRMLSQRLAKAWLAQALAVEPERARRAMQDSTTLFERQLATLQRAVTQPEIQATCAQLEARWLDFKTALTAKPPQLGATAGLLALDAQVLQLAHQGTLQIEALNARATHLVNLAGRQRMLSQRMAKFRLACAAPALAEAARGQIQGARQEFVQALDTLERAPEATPAIREQLALARGQWVFFEQGLLREGPPTPREASDLFISSENILQVMERITSLYARQGA